MPDSPSSLPPGLFLRAVKIGAGLAVLSLAISCAAATFFMWLGPVQFLPKNRPPIVFPAFSPPLSKLFRGPFPAGFDWSRTPEQWMGDLTFSFVMAVVTVAVAIALVVRILVAEHSHQKVQQKRVLGQMPVRFERITNAATCVGVVGGIVPAHIEAIFCYGPPSAAESLLPNFFTLLSAAALGFIATPFTSWFLYRQLRPFLSAPPLAVAVHGVAGNSEAAGDGQLQIQNKLQIQTLDSEQK